MRFYWYLRCLIILPAPIKKLTKVNPELTFPKIFKEWKFYNPILISFSLEGDLSHLTPLSNTFPAFFLYLKANGTIKRKSEKMVTHEQDKFWFRKDALGLRDKQGNNVRFLSTIDHMPPH